MEALLKQNAVSMNNLNNPRKKQFAGLDVLKFCMALLVVSIHARLFKEIGWLYDFVHPLKYSAVPIFFVISSYLFFSRDQIGLKALGHYLKRLGMFYLFWFVLLLPVTLRIRGWSSLVGFLYNLSLGSTFRGSWFIMALLIGIPIIYFARRVLHPFILLFVVYAIHLPFQYPDLWPNAQWGDFSFIPSLLWIDIGSLLASKAIGTAPVKKGISSTLLPLLYCGMLFRNFEPLLKPAFVVALFLCFLNCSIHPRPAHLTLRKMGILIYVLHFPFNNAVAYLALRVSPVFDNSFLQYFVLLGCASLIAWVILKLQTKPFFGWLKYAT